MRPKYFVGYTNEPFSNLSCDMLYAVYPDRCFYADVYGLWTESSLPMRFFEREQYYHPCRLKDVNAHFQNISAHKLKTVSVINKVEQQLELLGMQPAI